MTFAITKRARQSLAKTKKEPSLIFQFDGIAETFSSLTAFRYIRIGDAGLTIGDDWVIGGKVELDDQIESITFNSDIGSTSTEINYKLNPDKGFGDAVTQMNVAFVDDKANTILSLISSNEFLGRKCRVLLGPDPNDTVFPDDYIVIFRGVVDDMQFPPGGIVFSISSTEQKKRQTIYTSYEGTLPSGCNDSVTTITVDSVSKLLTKITGPDGANDAAFFGYILVDDELIRFTGTSGATITGCTRGALGTTAAAHDSGASFKTFYRLSDTAMNLALKIMLSGWNGPFKTGVSVTNFGYVNSSDTVASAVFFRNIDLQDLYGITIGDYMSATGFGTASANSFSNKEITSITRLDDGSSYVTVANGITNQLDASGVVSFRSKYDTLPDGLKMSPDEVDVNQHEYLEDIFLSTFSYDIYLKDTIDSGKEFLDNEVYKPIACYAVPRAARSSVTFTIGPLPTQSIKTLDSTNVMNAVDLRVRRSIGKNFYNTIIYKYDIDTLSDVFLKGEVDVNATSIATIPVGYRSLIIEAGGLRDANVAQSAATRRLNRYAFGAKFIDNVKVTFDAGFNLEVSDLVIVDGVSLKLPDFDAGTREAPARLYEIISKKINFETGDCILGLIDTSYTDAGRYALISPASTIKSGASNTKFTIQSSFESVYGTDEYLKWSRYSDLVVRVRNSAYSTSATGRIDSFSGNTVTLLDDLGFTPSASMIMELADYNSMTDQIKLLYGFVSSGSGAFDDGKKAYVMI